MFRRGYATVPTATRLGAAVLLSRVIAFAGGGAGVLWASRVAGWRQFDTTGLTSRFGAVGRVLSGSTVRWDSLVYLHVAQHGYTQAHQTDWFPLYSLAIRVLSWVIPSAEVAGVLVSAVAFVVGLVLLHRLCELELGRPVADATVLLLALAPLSFFFTAVYSESLFLALSVGAVYAARQERIALAGLLAALAAITRVTGVLLVVPIALLHLRRTGRPDRRLGWLALAPAGLLAFVVYLDADGYGWLAPLKNQGTNRTTPGPIGTAIAAISHAWHGVRAIASGQPPYAPSIQSPFLPGVESIVLLIVLAVAVAALVETFRRLPLAYGAYATAALLVSISSSTTIQPLYSVDRYVLTMFPLWMAAAAWLTERRATLAALAIGAALLGFYAFEFSRWVFVA